jgi:hypothetical protein
LSPDNTIEVTISNPQTTIKSHEPNVPMPGAKPAGREVKAEDIVPGEDESKKGTN